MDANQDSLKQLQQDLARQLTGGNSVSEAASSMGLSETDLVQSRETLFRKRCSQSRHLLPRTAELLKPNFVSVYRQFADDNHINGPNAIPREAIAFALWLAPWIAGQHANPPWVAELARWETSGCYWSTSKIFVWLFKFEYDFQTSSTQSTDGPKKRRNFWVVARCYKWSMRRRLF
jgi:hypothetical protein